MMTTESITITYTPHSITANYYYLVNAEIVNTYKFPTIDEAMRELRRLERLCGHSAELEINRYDPAICYKSIRYTVFGA